MVHMKCQALFSMKLEKLSLMSSAAVVIGTLRVNPNSNEFLKEILESVISIFLDQTFVAKSRKNCHNHNMGPV